MIAFKLGGRFFSVAFIAVLSQLGGCASQRLGVSAWQPTAQAPALEKLADSRYATGFNGIAFVASPDKVMLEKAYGRLTPDLTLPLKTDSVFRIASISKQVTAILVMQQVAEGRLALDETLGRYWPEFPNADARAVSLRQLLMHTSGLPNPNALDDFYSPSGVSDSHMRISAETVCAASLQRKPGAAFEYNNCDYLVLGALLERVTKMSFAALVTARIFQPAGMSNAGMYARDTPGLQMHAQGVVNGTSDGTVNPSAYAAAGGLFGTVRDIWQLNRAFADGRLLNAVTQQVMTTPNQWGAAIGVWSYELKSTGGDHFKVVERQGWIGGIRVVNLLDLQSGLSVIVMSTNGDYDLSQSWSGKGLAAELLFAAMDATR